MMAIFQMVDIIKGYLLLASGYELAIAPNQLAASSLKLEAFFLTKTITDQFNERC